MLSLLVIALAGQVFRGLGCGYDLWLERDTVNWDRQFAYVARKTTDSCSDQEIVGTPISGRSFGMKRIRVLVSSVCSNH